MSDAKFFHYKCPYNDKPCLDFQCDGCPVEEEEKKLMDYIDFVAKKGDNDENT